MLLYAYGIIAGTVLFQWMSMAAPFLYFFHLFLLLEPRHTYHTYAHERFFGQPFPLQVVPPTPPAASAVWYVAHVIRLSTVYVCLRGVCSRLVMESPSCLLSPAELCVVRVHGGIDQQPFSSFFEPLTSHLHTNYLVKCTSMCVMVFCSACSGKLLELWLFLYLSVPKV